MNAGAWWAIGCGLYLLVGLFWCYWYTIVGEWDPDTDAAAYFLAAVGWVFFLPLLVGDVAKRRRQRKR